MSNLLKSKFFLGVMVVAFAFAGAALVADAAYMHTMTLKQGMSGSQVLSLQQALNVSPQSGYFGNITKGAVMAFQASHGLVADGVVGPMTGAALSGMGGSSGLPAGCSSSSGFSTTTGAPCSGGSSSSLPAGCSSTSGYSSTTGKKCDSSSSSSSDGTLSGGETSINDFDLSDAEDSDLEEGQSEAEVAQIEFDVEDADAELDRADLIFAADSGTANEEDKPWKVFDTVYLMNGSDVIAEMDVDDQDAWDETDTDDVYRVRLSNIGEVFDEGDSVNLSVAVDVASSVDGADVTDAADWDVFVASNLADDDGLRFTDSEGIDTYVGEGTDEAHFDIEEAGSENQFSVQSSDDDLDATTLQVENDEASDNLKVFVFEVEADEDSTEDLEVEDFTFTLTVGNPAGGDPSITIADVVDEVTVSIGGEEHDADAVSTDTDDAIVDSATDTAVYDADLDDGDFVVAAGDTETVEVWIKFHSQAAYDNGTTVSLAVDDTDFEGEVVGVDSDENVSNADITGSSTGETHTLFTDGIDVNFDEANFTETSDDNGDTTKVTYTVEFDITAFGEQLFVPKLISADDGSDLTPSASAGLVYEVEGSSGTTIDVEESGGAADGNDVILTAHGELESTADENDDGDGYRIDDGDTEHFTATISIQGGTSFAAGFYRVQLLSVLFDEDQDFASLTTFTLTPEEDFDTELRQLDA